MPLTITFNDDIHSILGERFGSFECVIRIKFGPFSLYTWAQILAYKYPYYVCKVERSETSIEIGDKNKEENELKCTRTHTRKPNDDIEIRFRFWTKYKMNVRNVKCEL